MPCAVKPSEVREAAKRVYGESVRVEESAVSYLRSPAVILKINGERTLEFTGKTSSKARAFALEVLSQLAEAPP